LASQSLLVVCDELYHAVQCIAVQIEERDKDKRRVLKKMFAEHTSKSKMKEKMLVRMTPNFASFQLSLQYWRCGFQFVSAETLFFVFFHRNVN